MKRVSDLPIGLRQAEAHISLLNRLSVPPRLRHSHHWPRKFIVDSASYPTEKIAKNSHDFRPLGLGFANLGALLMSMGIPYDSPEGRDWAGAISAVMCGQAYLTSARIAEAVGPCAGLCRKRAIVPRCDPECTGARCTRHRQPRVPDDLYDAAAKVWNDAYDLGEHAGFRNAQTTVIAPTGTIGFMMDCDTTGIEPTSRW